MLTSEPKEGYTRNTRITEQNIKQARGGGKKFYLTTSFLKKIYFCIISKRMKKILF